MSEIEHHLNMAVGGLDAIDEMLKGHPNTSYQRIMMSAVTSLAHTLYVIARVVADIDKEEKMYAHEEERGVIKTPGVDICYGTHKATKVDTEEEK